MKYFVVLSLLILTACSSNTRIVREAYPIPTPYVPEAPATSRPVIDLDNVNLSRDINSLSSEDRGQIIKAYRIAATQWKAYALELEAIVIQYRAAGEQTKAVADILQSEIDRINSQAGDLLKQIQLEDATNKAKKDATPTLKNKIQGAFRD